MRRLLTLFSLVGLAACGPTTYVASNTPADPCDPGYYSPALCQQAIAGGGFYYQGTFVPHVYVHPYGYYSSGYTTYIHRGGVVHVVSPSYYSRSYVTSRPSVVQSGRTVYTRPLAGQSGGTTLNGYSPRASVPRTTVISPRSYSRPSSGFSYSRPSAGRRR